jgi:hypothetical protein
VAISYVISRISPKTRRKIELSLWVVGPLAALPPLVVYGLGYGVEWFHMWLHPLQSNHHIVSGLYTLITGVALFITSMVVGDEVMQMRSYDRPSFDMATAHSSPIGYLVFFCQLGGILVSFFGLIKLGAVVAQFVCQECRII